MKEDGTNSSLQHMYLKTFILGVKTKKYGIFHTDRAGGGVKKAQADSIYLCCLFKLERVLMFSNKFIFYLQLTFKVTNQNVGENILS